MSPLVAFLAGLLPAFASGLWARPYIDRFLKESHMSDRLRTRVDRVFHALSSPRLLVPAIALVAVTASISLVYTVQSNAENDIAQVAAAKKATDDTQAVIGCINGYIVTLSKSSKTRTDANTAKDQALTRVIKAAEPLMLDGAPSAAERAIARKALAEYLETAKALESVRVTTPVPTFSVEFCESLR